MADTTLVLDGNPQTITLSATTVSRVIAPVGTRYLEVSCSAAFLQQTDLTQAIADGAAVTAANAMYYPAGRYLIRVDGSGSLQARLAAARKLLFYANAATPSLFVRALSVGP